MALIKFSDLFEDMNTTDTALVEKLIMIKQGAKFGQIVFMSGGAGGGKGFASKQFMESDKFKVRDVDELKKAMLALQAKKKLFPELEGLKLKNPEDVYKLHMFAKKKGFADKTLDLLLGDLRSDRMPNILFDITGKHESDFFEYIPYLLEAGYELINMHLVWVLVDYKVAYKANLSRERVVPADVFLSTHVGAATTMQKIIDREKLPGGMNGSFTVILNNRDNTTFYQVGDEFKGKTITTLPVNAKGKTMNIVKDFTYITVKREGKPFRKPDDWSGDFQDKLADAINANAPKNSRDITDLKAIEDEHNKAEAEKK